MTLKKSKRGQAIKAQSIFEYFILTTAVVAVVLFFASTPHFRNIKNSCENAFKTGIGQIKGVEETDTIGALPVGGIDVRTK